VEVIATFWDTKQGKIHIYKPTSIMEIQCDFFTWQFNVLIICIFSFGILFFNVKVNLCMSYKIYSTVWKYYANANKRLLISNVLLKLWHFMSTMKNYTCISHYAAAFIWNSPVQCFTTRRTAGVNATCPLSKRDRVRFLFKNSLMFQISCSNDRASLISKGETN